MPPKTLTPSGLASPDFDDLDQCPIGRCRSITRGTPRGMGMEEHKDDPGLSLLIERRRNSSI